MVGVHQTKPNQTIDPFCRTNVGIEPRTEEVKIGHLKFSKSICKVETNLFLLNMVLSLGCIIQGYIY